MNVTALIPMKGHSERVPNKNLRMLCGKPLCYWIIETLEHTEYVNRIVIDTDSNVIAEEVTRHFDVEIIRRPEALIGDFVSVNKLIKHDISLIDADYYVQTHSTNPLLKSDTVDRAIEVLLGQDKHDSLFSVTRVFKRFYWEDGSPVNHNPNELLRTQDLPPIYEENSNFYVFSKESFEKKELRIGEKPMMFEMDPLEAWDIDDADDFIIAELLMKNRIEGGEQK